MHVEHLIIAFLTDSDLGTRGIGMNLLTEARRQEQLGLNPQLNPNGVRTFLKLEPHQVNWDADNYVDFVDIETFPAITEPSITKDLSQAQVIFNENN